METYNGIINDIENVRKWKTIIVTGVKSDWRSQKQFKERYKNAIIQGGCGSYRIKSLVKNDFIVNIIVPDENKSFKVNISKMLRNELDLFKRKSVRKFKNALLNKEIVLTKNDEKFFFEREDLLGLLKDLLF